MSRGDAGPAVVVDHVSKRYRVYHERNQSLKAALLNRKRAGYEEFWALKDVSLEIEHGATFGLIGENGCGKSTLLKCIANILRPDEGRVAVSGKVSALIELGAGFHPELSGRDNTFLNGSLLGLSTKEVERRFDDIVEFAGLGHFIDTPVKNYSSGMFMRLGFAIAINVDPEILLVDEILAVGDEQFQRRCLQRIGELRDDGCTIIIVSHALETMRVMCDRAALISHGELQGVGPAGAMIDRYLGFDPGTIARPTAGSSRWGTGELLIRDLEFLAVEGGPLPSLETGGAVRVRCHYSTSTPIESPSFGIHIRTKEGIFVGVPTSSDAGLDTGTISTDGYVDLVLPRVALGPGSYTVTAFVHDRELHRPYDVRHAFLDFSVQPGDDTHHGVVELEARWELP